VVTLKQVLLFSFIPLALVFAGVIIGSMDGIDSEREVFPTAAPRAETAGPPTPSAPGETVIQLRASNLLFDKRALTATANAPVNVQFDNADAGVLHNFALYNNQSLAQKIFVGELTTGPNVTNYKFTAPAAGAYFFRCDVHPDTMTGSFTVR
jgi:plastocyanin